MRAKAAIMTRFIVIMLSIVEVKTACEANSGSLSSSMDVNTTFTAVGAPSPITSILAIIPCNPLFPSPVVNIPNVKNTKLLTIVTNAKTEIVIWSLSRIVIKGILKFPALK